MSGVLALMLGGARPLAATTNGTLFYGSISSAGTATTSPACVVTATGGSGSYTYAWTRTSGDASTSISNASAASVTWSRTFGLPSVQDSFWQCVVTDTGTAQTVTITGIQAELERII